MGSKVIYPKVRQSQWYSQLYDLDLAPCAKRIMQYQHALLLHGISPLLCTEYR